MTAPDSRLARLADEADVTRVLYDYCALVDANRQADVLDLFTDDAVYDHGHGRVFRGRTGLAELFRALDDNVATSHHLSNVRVRLSHDDEALADSCLYAFHRRRATGDVVHLWGRYADTLVRAGGSWRLRSRALFAAAEQGVAPDPGWASRYQFIDRIGRDPDGRTP
jgi:3-phenylpropionate/cinnamic acid dioxygenase small subunit